MEAVELLLKQGEENGKKLDEMARTLSEHGVMHRAANKALFGNGRPGLVERVGDLEKDAAINKNNLNNHEESDKETKTDWKWLIATAITVTAVIIAFVK